jgi:hypothetical protein
MMLSEMLLLQPFREISIVGIVIPAFVLTLSFVLTFYLYKFFTREKEK